MPYSTAHIFYRKNAILFFAFLGIFSAFIIAASLAEPLKYLKYALPVLSAIFLFVLARNLQVRKTALVANQRWRFLLGSLAFYAIALSVNFIKGFNDLRFYQEAYFIFSPILFAFFLLLLMPTEGYDKAIPVVFWGITVAYIFEKFPYFLEILKHPSMLADAFMTSELSTESNFAFQFGMFFLVFLERGKKKYALLTLLLLLLSFKRIAIAGVAIYLVLKGIQLVTGKKRNPAGNKFLITAFNGVVVGVLFLFFTGAFNELIEERLGVTSNFLTQGRYNIYQDIFAHFGRIDILGFGLGSINVFLTSKGYELNNLHSDLLKVFFELGPVIFVAWIYLFHRWANTFLSSCLAIYMNVLFLTDNVLIYFDVMFVYYFLMLYSLDLSKTKDGLMPQAASGYPASLKTE